MKRFAAERAGGDRSLDDCDTPRPDLLRIVCQLQKWRPGRLLMRLWSAMASMACAILAWGAVPATQPLRFLPRADGVDQLEPAARPALCGRRQARRPGPGAGHVSVSEARFAAVEATYTCTPVAVLTLHRIFRENYLRRPRGGFLGRGSAGAGGGWGATRHPRLSNRRAGSGQARLNSSQPTSPELARCPKCAAEIGWRESVRSYRAVARRSRCVHAGHRSCGGDIHLLIA